MVKKVFVTIFLLGIGCGVNVPVFTVDLHKNLPVEEETHVERFSSALTFGAGADDSSVNMLEIPNYLKLFVGIDVSPVFWGGTMEVAASQEEGVAVESIVPRGEAMISNTGLRAIGGVNLFGSLDIFGGVGVSYSNMLQQMQHTVFISSHYAGFMLDLNAKYSLALVDNVGIYILFGIGWEYTYYYTIGSSPLIIQPTKISAKLYDRFFVGSDVYIQSALGFTVRYGLQKNHRFSVGAFLKYYLPFSFNIIGSGQESKKQIRNKQHIMYDGADGVMFFEPGSDIQMGVNVEYVYFF